MTDVRITETTIPKDIAAAIFKTSLEIGQLGKSEENKFGHYKFVSIDKYYENVAQVALRNGLTWTCKELNSFVLEGSNPEKPVLKFQYFFTLVHESGQCVPGIDNISVYHAFQGAQTAGSAGSYGEKLFMRRMFKVVTGEQDADASDPDVSFKDGQSKDTPVSQVDLDFELDAASEAPYTNEQEKKPGLVVVPNAAQEEADEEVGEKSDTDTHEEVQEGDTPSEKPTDDAPPEEAASEESGEEDLDALAPRNEDSGLRIIEAAKGEENWDIVFKAFETFMPEITKAEDTMEWWNANSVLLEQMEDAAPATHKKITRLFKTAYTKLNKEKK